MQLLTINNLKSDTNIDVPGVYQIYIQDNNKPLIINRLLKQDDSGLIYIGAAEKTNIHYRLKCFLNSKDPDRRQNNHTAGNKILHQVKLQKLIDQNKLFYNFITTKEAKKLEKSLIRKYINEFGEVPPLNG